MEGEDKRLKRFTFKEKSPAFHVGLGRFYNNRTFSDLTIVTPDGDRIHLHQVVLASCSKRFSDVLEQGNLQGEELPVRGVDPAGLDAVLRFFYSGECVLDYTNVIPVYDAAHRLDVPSLVLACEQFSNEVLEPSTACTLLQQAQQFLMHDYVEQCLAVVRGSFEQVTLELPDFLSSSFQTLARILADAASNQAEEATVFKAAWRWGTAELPHMQFLPEILQVVKVPGDLSVEELMRLSAGKVEVEGGPAEPAWPALQQVLLQHVLAGLDIASAVRKVAEEAAAVSAASLATVAAAAAAKGGSGGGGGTSAPTTPSGGGSDGAGGTGGGGPAAAALVGQGAQQAAQLLQQAGVLGRGLSNNPGQTMHLSQDGRVTVSGGMGGYTDMQLYGSDASLMQGMGNNYPTCTISGQRTIKGLCQVDGCYHDLTGLRDYHGRYKICEVHLKAPSIMKDGVPQRFCQQCGRFHMLDEFDGDKRSCRARLQKHNARRRKKSDVEGTDLGGGGMGGSNKQARMDMHGYQQMGAGGYYGQAQGQRGDVGFGGMMDARGLVGGAGGMRGVGSSQQQQQQQLQSSLALALLANAAQQQDGGAAAAAAFAAARGAGDDLSGLNGSDAAAMALSALGALAAAHEGGGGEGEDGRGGDGMDGSRGGAGSSAQQILEDLAAGHGLTAWQLAALGQGGAAGAGGNGMDPTLETLLALAGMQRGGGGAGAEGGGQEGMHGDMGQHLGGDPQAMHGGMGQHGEVLMGQQLGGHGGHTDGPRDGNETVEEEQ